jgi:hypothetical protein
MTKTLLTLDQLRGEGRIKGLCKVGRVIRDLTPEDRAIVVEALAGPEDEFPSGRIATVLGAMGFSVGSDAIIKHRRGGCACKSL